MSADLLRRAAKVLRAEDVPDGAWCAGPVDPRPNFGLWCGSNLVADMNWGKESFTLPEFLATLLNARRPLAAWLDAAAEVVESNDQHDGFDLDAVDDTYRGAVTTARAILREASS